MADWETPKVVLRIRTIVWPAKICGTWKILFPNTRRSSSGKLDLLGSWLLKSIRLLDEDILPWLHHARD